MVSSMRLYTNVGEGNCMRVNLNLTVYSHKSMTVYNVDTDVCSCTHVCVFVLALFNYCKCSVFNVAVVAAQHSNCFHFLRAFIWHKFVVEFLGHNAYVENFELLMVIFLQFSGNVLYSRSKFRIFLVIL